MNKAELIAQLAEDAGITKTQANAALDSFVDTVTKTLKKGDKVTIYGGALTRLELILNDMISTPYTILTGITPRVKRIYK